MKPEGYQRLLSDGTWSALYTVGRFEDAKTNLQQLPKKVLEDVHYLLLKEAVADVFGDLELRAPKKWHAVRSWQTRDWIGNKLVE